jgi:putative hydrolases of HD superfamily
MTFLDFFSEVGKLKKIKRTGWVRDGIPDSESVADHNFRVAFMCMILAKSDMDTNKIIKMALMHELGEVIIGDVVVSRAGITNPQIKKAKEKYEEEAVRKLCAQFGDKNDCFKIWKEFNEGKSEEAKFVRDADELEAALQAYEYEREYGLSLDEFYVNAKKHITDPQLITLLNKLISMRK